MDQSLFFALVGAAGSGKTTIHKKLKEIFGQEYVFLCDSSGSGDTQKPYAGFTKSFTSMTNSGFLECMTPLARLSAYWARLTTLIHHEVRPALNSQKRVIINGFGGTNFAEAYVRTEDITEREAILDLHLSHIKNCVRGQGVPPPVYLWLCVSPEVAYQRLKASGSLPNVDDPHRHVDEINKALEFYGTLHGQTVIRIDADKPPECVIAEILSLMRFNELQATSVA